jgi:metallo-beta-lactamase class B
MQWKQTVAGGLAMLAVGVSGAFAAEDPLTKPIAEDFAARWLTPQDPIRIHGQTYFVGYRGLSVALIKTGDGLILLDGAVPQSVAGVEANIRKLGFKVEDIKLILSTEPHYDHAGGIAALARDSGATTVASAAAAKVLERGASFEDDPQAAWLERFPAVTNIRVVKDGEAIRLGDTTVFARATPGHTGGSMSWNWRSCEGKSCVNILFASSLNPVAADGWRFSDHEDHVAMFRRTYAAFRKLPCDIVLTTHPDQDGGDVKLARLAKSRAPNPFVEKGACRALADKYEGRLDAKLADEARGAARQ